MTRIHDFALIIGAMEAGANGLYDALAGHPAIAAARRKEPSFFGANWSRGRDWYEALWPDYDPVRHAWAMEVSTNYTKHPMDADAAARIGGFDARFRFLYIVRDPVDRIEAHIAHGIAKGRATRGNYAKLMEHAVNVSRYAHQLEHFRKGAGGAEVLVLDLDALEADPRAVLRRCTDFLGVDGGVPLALGALPEDRPAGSFRLSDEERRDLRRALADDTRRLRDEWGVDTGRWSDETAASKPRSPSSPATIPAPGSKDQDGYWRKRKGMMYYEYIRTLATPLARGAKSLIDVGSHSTSIAEEFDWIPERVALDLRTPYASETVRGIKADFLRFTPERRYDFALCLQVLEHVPEAGAFARKLLAVADRVLVSVPYRWPEGQCKFHCQDPVDEAKLAGWFGREPDYQIIVEEPFRERDKSRRLIAYFHSPGEKLDLKRYRNRAPRGDGAEAVRLAQQHLARAG
jgi:Sulfotransferase domain